MAEAGSSNNVFQFVAEQQTAEAERTPSDQLFQDALDEVLQTETKEDTKLVQKLGSLRDENSTRQALENEFQASKFFGPTATKKWVRKISPVADHINDAKPYLEKFLAISLNASKLPPCSKLTTMQIPP